MINHEETAAQTEPPKAARLKDETISKLNYSVTEAAHALGVGRSTVYELIASDELESFRLRGRRLIPADACAALQAAYRGRSA